MKSWCWKRIPGYNHMYGGGNGGLSQTVYLIAGTTYAFDCNVAYLSSQCCSMKDGGNYNCMVDGMLIASDACGYIPMNTTIRHHMMGTYTATHTGPVHAGADYLVLASLGCHPGCMISGVHVPLNPDLLFFFSMAHANSAMLQNTMATLDASGEATAVFDTLGPVQPEVLGQTISFGYLLLTGPMTMPVTYASFPVLVNFIP